MPLHWISLSNLDKSPHCVKNTSITYAPSTCTYTPLVYRSSTVVSAAADRHHNQEVGVAVVHWRWMTEWQEHNWQVKQVLCTIPFRRLPGLVSWKVLHQRMVLCVWWFPKGVLNKNTHHTPWRLLLFGTSVIRTPLALQSVIIIYI